MPAWSDHDVRPGLRSRAASRTVTSVPKLDVVGLQEIAERLGVKRQTAQVWHYRGRLPQPDAVVSGNVPVWRWSSIAKWARQTGRLRDEIARSDDDR